MAGKVRFLQELGGRYFARRVVPIELRAILGKSELRAPLGADRRHALDRLPAALVSFMAEMDHATQQLAAVDAEKASRLAARTEPLAVGDLARAHYLERLTLDDTMRNAGSTWASIQINDAYVEELRGAAAGKLTNERLERLLGDDLRKYALRGWLTAPEHTPAWRQIARAIAEAELEALTRVVERDEGGSRSQEHHPAHLAPVVALIDTDPFIKPLSLRGLLDRHLKELEKSGRGRSARKAWTPVFEDLLDFLKDHRRLKGSAIHQRDDVRRLTVDEVIAWRDAKLANMSQKSVKDVYLASLKSVLNRALEDRLISENVASHVKVRLSHASRLREKGFTDEEATQILQTCLDYSSPIRSNRATQESAHVANAKRWGPWLCAFTGARVGEVLQLRKEDIKQTDGINFLRLTPEAGTVKSRRFRDIPIHPQLLELGFLDFVSASAAGPLFHSKLADPEKLPAQAVSTRVGKWLQELGLIPEDVAPSHGWRHRFKTLARELDLDPRVVDGIQGHEGRSSSDHYGDVSVRVKKIAVDKFAFYSVRLPTFVAEGE